MAGSELGGQGVHTSTCSPVVTTEQTQKLMTRTKTVEVEKEEQVAPASDRCRRRTLCWQCPSLTSPRNSKFPAERTKSAITEEGNDIVRTYRVRGHSGCRSVPVNDWVNVPGSSAHTGGTAASAVHELHDRTGQSKGGANQYSRPRNRPRTQTRRRKW